MVLLSYHYKNSHCIDKMVSQSCYLGDKNCCIHEDSLYFEIVAWEPLYDR